MRRALLGCGLALVLATSGAAAMPAALLGPEAAPAAPEGGFVGRLSITPEHGPMGTKLTVTAEGLPADQPLTLVWRTVKGSWDVAGAEYHGRSYAPVGYAVATPTSDHAGRVVAHFTAPEDFGFLHDIVLQQGHRVLTQVGFALDMTVHLATTRGPVGTPIAVEVAGIGWRELENSWLLLYDNQFTGWISAVTTNGTARFTIPATGAAGRHVLEVLHGEFTFPYRNMQQNPEPDRPRFALGFTVTPGAPVLPPAPAAQAQGAIRGLAPPGELAASPSFAGIGRTVTVRGVGLGAGRSYDLDWVTVTGNRVGGNGWDEQGKPIARASADAAGNVAFAFAVPDDLGGAHRLVVHDGETLRQGSFWLATTALPLDVASGPVGTTFAVHLKGVGWTETANIYTVVYDNAYIGYACGFNSQGDVEIFLKATGAPGWHFIDLYPAIYKGKEVRPDNFRIPQLTYAADHPGEDLPHFAFAFHVTEDRPATQATR